MALYVKSTLILFKPECVKESSLGKQPAFGDATNWFPREMMSEKRAQKFGVITQNWVVLLISHAAREIYFDQSEATLSFW